MTIPVKSLCYSIVVVGVLLFPEYGDARGEQQPATCKSGPAISFSFDDGFDPTINPGAANWNASILKALAEADLEVIYFVSGGIVDSPQGMKLVEEWSAAGHRIGNHTYSHQNLNSTLVSADQFVEDIVRNERLLSGIDRWTKRVRFPYLKEGKTLEERDYVRKWLRENGYRSGAVSIDASDWYYSDRFSKWRAKKPNEDMSRFRKAYLDHLWDRAQYYEALAQQLRFGCTAHVMLLHTNELNAVFLPDVIEMFRNRGWRISHTEKAFESPLYGQQPSVLPAGESILWAMAKEADEANLRYPAEDARYEKPLLDALDL